MAIIRYTKDATIRYAYLNIFPDQFKTEKEKMDESWIKNTMDYFANKAYAEYVKNRDTFVKNYDLVKGILRMEDFYQEPQVKSFTEMLTTNLELPAYVKMYSIITTPLNELIGEISKRPDTFRVHCVSALETEQAPEPTGPGARWSAHQDGLYILTGDLANESRGFFARRDTGRTSQPGLWALSHLCVCRRGNPGL